MAFCGRRRLIYVGRLNLWFRTKGGPNVSPARMKYPNAQSVNPRQTTLGDMRRQSRSFYLVEKQETLAGPQTTRQFKRKVQPSGNLSAERRRLSHLL